MKALLIIDVQNDFCPGGSLGVPGGNEIVPVINRLAEEFEFVAATKDWHPTGHVSFASTHGKKPGETIETASGEQMLWPDHCVRTESGSDFHPDLDLGNVRLILHKGIHTDLDSYSAFYENDGETSTSLAPYLKGLGIDEIYLCGLATDYCVYFSALDGLREGFRTNLIIDGCRAVDIPENSEKNAIADMKKRGVKIITSSEL